MLQDSWGYESIIKEYAVLFPESNPKCFLSDLSTMGLKCPVHYIHISSKAQPLSFKCRGQEGMLSAPHLCLSTDFVSLERDFEAFSIHCHQLVASLQSILPWDLRGINMEGSC